MDRGYDVYQVLKTLSPTDIFGPETPLLKMSLDANYRVVASRDVYNLMEEQVNNNFFNYDCSIGFKASSFQVISVISGSQYDISRGRNHVAITLKSVDADNLDITPRALLRLQKLLGGDRYTGQPLRPFYQEGNRRKLKTLEKQHGVIIKRGQWASKPEVVVFGKQESIDEAVAELRR